MSEYQKTKVECLCFGRGWRTIALSELECLVLEAILYIFGTTKNMGFWGEIQDMKP